MSSKYTPMIEQYLQVKAQVPDAFLFFRLGDFYELFFDDAVQAARELEITLTGRDGGSERVPMCGVPYHSAETYIRRLVEKGYKVAICEQMEDPATAKGVVRREIVRIVTPGTVMEDKPSETPVNNFLASVAEKSDGFGLAVCDLTTGELYATSVETLEQLKDELIVYDPAEIIGDERLLARVRKSAGLYLAGAVPSVWTEQDRTLLEQQFPSEERDTLPAPSADAVALLLAYLRETQRRTLAHLSAIRRYDAERSLWMDPFTRRNLELVESARDRSKKGSLLGLLDRTATAMGARLLRRWLDKPLIDRPEIERRLEAVECLVNRSAVRDEIFQILKEMYDLERLVGRIAYGNCNARDLVALRVTLERVPALKACCLSSGSATLERLLGGVDDCADLRDRIAEAIVDDPPISVREGGMIRPGYHERLDQLREASTDGKRWIAELEQRERELTGIRSLKVGYNKVFGYYIEVTRPNLAAVPEDRYERRQTLAHGERFVTRELKEKEALILEAEERMVELEYELFSDLREKIAGQIPRLQKLAAAVAAVDVLQSFATVSAERRYTKPVVTDGYSLRIEGGRHPVVEAALGDRPFVANDTLLEEDGDRILLITGPNMAGKSTYMRQVALIAIMAQIGCFVPARRAELPIVDRIFTRIGAADDLAGGQSTFMVEMREIRTMTARATRRSLVIIDELGRGTSTAEGMAIAQAVIEYLHDRVGCKTLVSTHYHELAYLEERLRHLSNYSMAVRESDGEVMFLHKFVRGAANSSYGIYCARVAGLPEEIIERAYELVRGYEAKAAEFEHEQAVRETAGGRDADDAIGETVVQLSLFAEPVPERPKTASRKERQVLDRIREADLVNMTPLSALNLLFELRQKLLESR